jgi:hypothetical protein
LLFETATRESPRKSVLGPKENGIMAHGFRLPEEVRFGIDPEAVEAIESSDRALKSFRYVVASVDEDALKAWNDLWEQLKNGVTPAGMVLPEMEQGFMPACGWGEFLEKFWLMKHYLDYIHRFCKS